MAKAELKTKRSEASVESFLKTLSDSQQQTDSRIIVSMMQKISGDPPKMWGPAIIGFGNMTLKYDSGRELEWMKIGFSPRKANLTLYGVLSGNEKLSEKLGKFTTGKGCLYIKKLTDVDQKVLEKMIAASLKKKG
jgi:hypothetical protein